jgi:hypothetical protein
MCVKCLFVMKRNLLLLLLTRMTQRRRAKARLPQAELACLPYLDLPRCPEVQGRISAISTVLRNHPFASVSSKVAYKPPSRGTPQQP